MRPNDTEEGMSKKILLVLVFMVNLASYAAESVLDDYVVSALTGNLALRQKDFVAAKSFAALREARGMFFPALNFSARYSRAGGGRVIDFPVGDLINPIHFSLNQLLQAPLFPGNLPNVRTPFLREQEHETKIQLLAPIFQPAIYYNQEVKRAFSDLDQAARNAFARELVAEVKKSYFNYLKTLHVLELYRETRKLVQENLRVNASLFENDKVTQDVLFRAQAELTAIDQQTTEAERQMRLACNYFNFLLNRAFDEPIIVSDTHAWLTIPDSLGIINKALQYREELIQLGAAIRAAKNGIRISQSAFLPCVIFVLDYGYQGESYRFSPDNDFWMASAVLQWNLFKGFQDKQRIEQAELDRRRLELQYKELEGQIRLQIRTGYLDVVVASKAIVSTQEALLALKKSFQIVQKKYNQGMASHIEFLDARHAMTRAELDHIVSQYDFLIAQAQWERVTAQYPIELYPE